MGGNAKITNNNKSERIFGAGGVYVAGTTGTFEMGGDAEISGNSVTIKEGNSSFTSAGAGGVYVRYGTFKMSGNAKVTDNSIINKSSKGVSGGVYIDQKGAMTVSGNANVTSNTGGNVYLTDGKSITVDGDLGETAAIGVRTPAIADGSSATVVTGAKETDLNRFSDDSGNNYTIKFANGNILFTNGEPHEHPICGDKNCTESGHGSALFSALNSAVLSSKTAAGYYELPAGNWYLTENLSLDATLRIANNATLCLNGYSITTAAAVDAIELTDGAEFVLCDCKRGGTATEYGRITHGTNAAGGKYNGRGIYIANGNLTMYGGSISGNSLTGVSEAYNTTSMDGVGGGVCVVTGAFTMYDGEISDNTLSGDYNKGAGVYVKQGTDFTMTGGTVSGNTMSGSEIKGAGICNYGTTTLGGTAEIRENQMVNTEGVRSEQGKDGVGIYTNGTLTVEGNAKIINNQTRVKGVLNSHGGGIYAINCTVVLRENAMVTGNQIGSYAGGIYCNCTLNDSGNVQITGNEEVYSHGGIVTSNVAFNYDKSNPIVFSVIGELSNTARIGVIEKSKVFNNGTDFFTFAKAAAPSAETAANWIKTGNFISDEESSYKAEVTENGTEAILKKHNHTWEYTASGATITAKCSECSSSGGSVTIQVPADESLTYSGRGKEATLNGRFSTGEAQPTISYTSQDGIINYAIPIDAGDYKASITAGGLTVSADYTVKKAKLTVTANENTIAYGDAPADKGVTYKGFVNNENESILNGSLNYTYSYDPLYPGTGLYIITPSGLTAKNYEIDFVPGTMTVTPREVTLAWNNTENRTYGDGKLVTVTAGNLVNGDTVEVAVSGGDYTAVGTHTANATGLTGSKAGNYKLPNDNTKLTVTYNISKGKLENKKLTMPVYKGVAKEYTYDFANELTGLTLGNIRYTGKLSDDFDVRWISKGCVELNGSVLSITTYDWYEGAQILEYVVTVGSDNYGDFTMTLKVNAEDKKLANLSIEMSGWSYGSIPNEPKVLNVPSGAHLVSTVYKNKKTGEVITPTAATDAGNYTVTVRYESDDTVYTGAADFVINPVDLNKDAIEVPDGVTADKTYDGTTNSDLTELCIDKGLFGTEADGALRIVGTSEYANPNSGATRLTFTTDGTIRLSDPSSSAKPGNYRTNPTNLTKIIEAKILQRELDFKVDSVSKIYGCDDTAAEAAVSFLPVSGKDKTGLVDGETLVQGVDYDVTAVFSKTEVGEDSNVRVTVTLKDTQKARNYTLNTSEITATGTIVPKLIPVLDGDLTLSANEITYGEKPGKIKISGAMKDPVTGAKVEGTFAWQKPDEVPDAGAYNASWTFTPAAGYGKYADTAGTVTVKVNKADILEGIDYTVPTAATSKLEYNGNEQELITAGTATVGKMQYKLGESGAWSEKIPTAANAGSYDVYYRVFGGNNYNTTEEQKITSQIDKRAVTVSNKAQENGGYQISYMYGYEVPKPLISNFDITGSEDGADFSHEWIDGEPKKYSEIREYKLKVTVGATANTAGGSLEIPVNIVRNTNLTDFGDFGYDVYNNTETVSYDIDFTPSTGIDTDSLIVDSFQITAFDADGLPRPYDESICGFKIEVTEKDTPKGTMRVKLTNLNKDINGRIFCTITVLANDKHYQNLQIEVQLTVRNKDAKPLGVTMDGFTYGGSAGTPSYTAPEGTLTTSVTYAKKDGTNLTGIPAEAGDYTVTVVCETKDTIYSGSADYTINPKPISDVDSYLDKTGFTYNGGEQKPNLTVKMNDTVFRESIDYTVTYPTDMTSAGTKEIKISGIGNFSGEKTVSYQINKATVKVKPKNISKIYGTEPKFMLESDSPLITEAELEKVVASAMFTSGGTEKTAPVTANGYVISAQLASSENTDINLSLIFEVDGTGVLTVEKADLTITVKDVSREYGAENPELEVIYSGFANNEDESVLSGELILKYDESRINEQTAVDHYQNATMAEGLTSDNYNINYVSGNVDITKIKVGVSAGAARKSYLSVVFDKSLEGLAVKNFTIKDSEGNTVAVNNVTASTDCKTYTLSGNFDVGSEYTVKVVLNGAAADATHQLTTDEFVITPIHISNGGSLASPVYTVSFETNGGDKVLSKTVKRNDTLTEPTVPVKDGFDFAGWYTDKELKEKYDFSAKVTKSMTLYAAWTEKDASANQIILTIGEKDALVFGAVKTNDVAPKITNDRTMLPARFVAENLGADVSWNGEKELVTIKGKNLKTSEDVTILIYIGSDIAYVNGKEIKLDSAAFIENDRTYTPVRFISEQLGASVDWIEAERKVLITK